MAYLSRFSSIKVLSKAPNQCAGPVWSRFDVWSEVAAFEWLNTAGARARLSAGAVDKMCGGRARGAAVAHLSRSRALLFHVEGLVPDGHFAGSTQEALYVVGHLQGVHDFLWRGQRGVRELRTHMNYTENQSTLFSLTHTHTLNTIRINFTAFILGYFDIL